MKRTRWRLCLSFFAAAWVMTGAAFFLLRAIAESKPPEPPPHANNAQAASPLLHLRDIGKSVIEFPTEKLLANRTVSTPAALPGAAAFVNPKVEPGKVRWHKDFAAACRAAKKTSKPVLLFQMMGKLDDQFC